MHHEGNYLGDRTTTQHKKTQYKRDNNWDKFKRKN